MAAEALTQLAIQYFSQMDDEHARDVIAYMEQIKDTDKSTKKRRLSDLKGKIQFSDDYDYKTMRK